MLRSTKKDKLPIRIREPMKHKVQPHFKDIIVGKVDVRESVQYGRSVLLVVFHILSIHDIIYEKTNSVSRSSTVECSILCVAFQILSLCLSFS